MPRKRKGITNKQASFLADLQRKAGERYTGNGMSRQEASEEIDRLLTLRDEVRSAHHELDEQWAAS